MPYPFSFILPSLNKLKEQKEAKPTSVSHQVISFEDFIKSCKRSKNSIINEFFDNVVQLETSAAFSRDTINMKLYSSLEDPDDIKIILKDILMAREKSLETLSYKTNPLSQEKDQVQYLIESEKIRRFMAQVMLCLKEEFFNFEDSEGLRAEFIRQYSEDFNGNLYNIAMGIYSEYFSLPSVKILCPLLEKEELGIFIYGQLENFLQIKESVDEETHLARFMHYPSLYFKYQAAINFAHSKNRSGMDSLKKSETILKNRAALFEHLKEFKLTNLLEGYQKIVQEETLSRKALEDHHKNPIRKIYGELLYIVKAFLDPIITTSLSSSENLIAQLNSSAGILEKIKVIDDKNYPEIAISVNLLDTMMRRCFDMDFRKVILCESIIQSLLKIIEKSNPKNLILSNAQDYLKKYLDTLNERKSLIIKMSKEDEEERLLESKNIKSEEIRRKKKSKEKIVSPDAELSQSLKTTKEALLKAEGEINKLKGKAQAHLNDEQHKINEIKRKVDAFEKQIKELTDTITHLNLQNSQLLDKVKTLETPKPISKQEQARQFEVAQLKDQLSRQEQDILALKKDNTSLATELRKKEQHILKQEKNREKVKKLASDLKNKEFEIAKAMLEGRTQLDTLETEKNKLTEKIARKEAEIQATQNNNIRMNATNNDLQVKMRHLTQYTMDLQHGHHILTQQLGEVAQTASILQQQSLFYQNIVSKMQSQFNQLPQARSSINPLELIQKESYLIFRSPVENILKNHPEFVTYYLAQSLLYFKPFKKDDETAIKSALQKLGAQNPAAYYSLLQFILSSGLPHNTFRWLFSQKLITPLVFPSVWPLEWNGCFNLLNWTDFVARELENGLHSASSTDQHFHFLSLILIAPYYHLKDKNIYSSDKELLTALTAHFLKAFSRFSEAERKVLLGKIKGELPILVKRFENYNQARLIMPSTKPSSIVFSTLNSGEPIETKRTEDETLDLQDKEGNKVTLHIAKAQSAK